MVAGQKRGLSGGWAHYIPASMKRQWQHKSFSKLTLGTLRHAAVCIDANERGVHGAAAHAHIQAVEDVQVGVGRCLEHGFLRRCVGR